MKPPPIPVSLPDDERVRDLNVKPHTLDGYDQLGQQKRSVMDGETQDNTEDEIRTDSASCKGDKNNDRDN